MAMGVFRVVLTLAADDAGVGIDIPRFMDVADAQIPVGNRAGLSLQGVAKFADNVCDDEATRVASPGHGENLAVVVFVTFGGPEFQLQILLDRVATLFDRKTHAESLSNLFRHDHPRRRRGMLRGRTLP